MYEEYLNVWLDTLDIRGEMQQAFIIEIKGTRSKKEKKVCPRVSESLSFLIYRFRLFL